MSSPLDEVLTHEQQLLLKKAILDAAQGDGYGLAYCEIHKGQVRRIFGGRSYDSSPAALNPAVAAVLPMPKRRRGGR